MSCSKPSSFNYHLRTPCSPRDSAASYTRSSPALHAFRPCYDPRPRIHITLRTIALNRDNVREGIDRRQVREDGSQHRMLLCRRPYEITLIINGMFRYTLPAWSTFADVFEKAEKLEQLLVTKGLRL